MAAEEVTNALLTGSSALVAEVADRIYPGEIPKGVVLPAIAYNHISTVEQPTINAAAQFALVQTRMQISVLAKSYAQQKKLITLVKKAMNYQRGTIATIIVNSIMRDIVGPDMKDSDAGIYFQTIDFRMMYHEQN